MSIIDRILVGVALTMGAATAQSEVNIHGSVRSRVEMWDWFDGGGDSQYAFSGNMLRLSAGRTGKRIDWLFEAEAPLLFGLPSNAVVAGAQGQLGLGGNYWAANDRNTNAGMLFPKQGYLRFKSGRQSVRLGRFEFSDGAETIPADATVAWLKRERIAQRLIGPFGWSHVGRSFDGMQYAWSGKNTNVTAIGVRPTRGAFQVDGWGELDVVLGYGAVTRSTGSADWRVFGAYYDDWRNIVKTDNRAAAVRSADRQAVRIGSVGGHYVRKAGRFDALLWGVVQAGRWGVQSHRAFAVAAEAGWQPAVLPKLKPWLRAGYFRSSGDGDPNDAQHRTFFQMLPTPRPYARTPFFNLMNNQDVMAAVIVRPHKAVSIRSEAHALRLSNRHDLWYSGGGAFQPWTFGYAGRPSGGYGDLAALYDISADYALNAHWSVTGYFGHVSGGEVVRSIYPAGDRANFGYVELNYKF
jgi:Alginate export